MRSCTMNRGRAFFSLKRMCSDEGIFSRSQSPRDQAAKRTISSSAVGSTLLSAVSILAITASV